MRSDCFKESRGGGNPETCPLVKRDSLTWKRQGRFTPEAVLRQAQRII